MELALNLAWVLLAVSILSLWLRFAPPSGAERRMQFVALAILILILFPVISVTDDLQVTQNPAEADCCLRRDHVVTTPHSIVPVVTMLPELHFSGLSVGSPRFAARGNQPTPQVDHPGLSAIENRPPPTA